ncbi:MAG: RNA-binding protein [Solobacterium sp.]|nr:RNA-binding protein [Solobacterium sp.]
MRAATSDSEILIRLRDLQQRAYRQGIHAESGFLSEEDTAMAMQAFKGDGFVRFDGGYPDALKKKVIFLRDEEDDFSDIVCLRAQIDKRFRSITHRDVLGALMHLQIERDSFGDLWVEDGFVYLYTTEVMGRFLQDNFTRIADQYVSFEALKERPPQQFRYKEIQAVMSSTRLDAVVSALAHVSRSRAKEMIRQGLVQVDHVTLVDADEVCNNNCKVSIRGAGRFILVGETYRTKKGRIGVKFLQSI